MSVYRSRGLIQTHSSAPLMKRFPGSPNSRYASPEANPPMTRSSDSAEPNQLPNKNTLREIHSSVRTCRKRLPDSFTPPFPPSLNHPVNMGQVTDIAKSPDSIPEKTKQVASLAVDKAVEKAKKESGSTASAIKSFIAGLSLYSALN
jgi:alkylhydroperoxidase/carboxymuconolactone decarboxylase family protein YurZ